MAQLRHDYDQISAFDTAVIVVGPDNAKQFTRFWQEHALQFIGLPDPKHRVLRLFGQEVNLFKLGRMPAQVIIDKDFIVRYAHYGHAMSDIPCTDEIVSVLQEINNSVEQGNDAK